MASVDTSTGRQALETSANTGSDASSSATQSIGTRTTLKRETTSSTTLELITATPSNVTPSGIEWGPAITASTLPGAEPAAPTASTQPSQHLSHQAKTTIIATTTIGGTFILAFLLYALWRRRRGATYSEIIHFRPRSATPILSPGPLTSHFTALPIYREERYSVHSSKRGSWLSFNRFKQKRADAQSPTARSFRRSSNLSPNWKSANPPTPTRSGHPLSYVAPAPPASVSSPEMAHVRSTSHTERIKIKRAGSEGDNGKSFSTVSAREVPSSSDTEAQESKTMPDSPSSDKEIADDGRWSWTNSQAPATPRMRTRSPTRRLSKQSSSSASVRSLRKIHSWIKPQNDRTIPEEQPTRRAPKPKLPPLKNKASKPVLAPINDAKPPRQMSIAKASPTTPERAGKGVPDSPFSLPLQRN